ncbi:MAG: type II secretion system protein, partial [Oligoflexales bacterium]|nr:type II secretion system protein [Oligoflexales bacterium]
MKNKFFSILKGTLKEKAKSKLLGKSGFTLIELMIVMSIMSVVSAIQIPSLLRARASANEASAISSLRTVVSAQAMFYQGDVDTSEEYDYATSLETLTSACMMDNVLGTGTKNGYTFQQYPSMSTYFRLRATPACSTCGLATYTVNRAGQIVSEVCGNGIIEGTETCDPGRASTSSTCPINKRCSNDCHCRSATMAPSEVNLICLLRQAELEATAVAEQSNTDTQIRREALSVLSLLNEATGYRGVRGAQRLLASPLASQIIFGMLDRNGDRKLDINELSGSAILRVAREAALKLSLTSEKVETDSARL